MLKLKQVRRTKKSHPTRGAWIEMGRKSSPANWYKTSHPTRGAWIEIEMCPAGAHIQLGRTPPGVRGLKSGYVQIDNECVGSHPTRGAWIEIPIIYDSNATSVLSHPTRGAWIEILRYYNSRP